MSEPSTPHETSPPHLVETHSGLTALAERVAAAPLVALDVEANSLYAYREQVCVLQLTVGDENAIVDTVALPDLSPLREALARDDVETVFHGGDYDVGILGRDHDFRFGRVFDTMIAATLLGEPRVGLADLVREAFGVELDKRFQTTDWAKRPFSPEQIDYLHRDTAYLPALRERLLGRLEDADLVEEAEIEFRHLAGRRAKPLAFDAEGWRRLKGVRRADATGRAVLHELHAWREAEAERRDLPPFKVLPPSVMLAIARDPPSRLDRIDVLKAVPTRLRKRHGRALLEALRQAKDRLATGRVPDEHDSPRPTRDERNQRRFERGLEDALRDWRRDEAKDRKVPNLVVLPNRALGWLVRELPTRVEELAAGPDVGSKRAARYGETILKILDTRRKD